MSREDSFQPRWRRLLLSLIILLIVGGTYTYRTVVLPRQLYDEAVKAALKNAPHAEQLAEQAIELSGGNYPQAELLRVRLLGVLGYWTEALGAFSLIDDFSNIAVDELVDVGNFAAQAQAIHLARNCYLAALESDATSVDALRQLIRLELSVGNEGRARKYCADLLTIDDKDATAWHILGVIALNQMEPDVAISSLQKAIDFGVQPQVPIREDLIQAMIDSGDYVGARRHLNELEKQGELTQRAQLENAYLLRLEGDADQAMKIVQHALDNQQGNLTAVIQLAGLLSFDLGQTEEAIKYFTKVLEVQPFNKEVHFKIAAAYRRMGEAELATEHLLESQKLTDQAIELQTVVESLKLTPDDNQLRKRAVELYRQLGKHDQADRLSRGMTSN